LATTSPLPQESFAALTPDEIIRTLSDEQKDAVLVGLVQEAIRLNGSRSVIALADSTGGPLGYLIPQAAAAAHLKATPPPLSPEREAAIRQAIATPENTFDMNRFLDDLSREGQD
jgi:hypothetical protein